MADIQAVGVDRTRFNAPAIRRISIADLKTALKRGWDDFWSMPTFIIFGGLLYPVVGLLLGRIAVGSEFVHLLFPLISGFALIGPIAGIWLYELSRRRELGMDTSLGGALSVLVSPAFGGILAMGGLLTFLFVSWLMIAEGLYEWLFGDVLRLSLADFLTHVLSSPRGWLLAMLGNAIGFGFAAFAFAISVVSFPMIVDRHVGAAEAMHTSIRACLENPGTMAIWALTIAVLLFIGSLPFFFGLTIVVPVLAHASWHLYRRVVEP